MTKKTSKSIGFNYNFVKLIEYSSDRPLNGLLSPEVSIKILNNLPKRLPVEEENLYWHLEKQRSEEKGLEFVPGMESKYYKEI